MYSPNASELAISPRNREKRGRGGLRDAEEINIHIRAEIGDAENYEQQGNTNETKHMFLRMINELETAGWSDRENGGEDVKS